MEINLKNKTAWVFGGSRGIGRSVALELAKVGANILLIARDQMALQHVKEELCTERQQEHDFISVDLSNTDLLGRMLSKYRNVGAVDIVINNTGGPVSGLAHTAELEEYSSAFNQHLLAAQVITTIALPAMKKRGFGRVINIVSTSVKQPIYGLGVSNTIRGAVANWAKTLSVELAPFGVTVNNVLPGATKTDRLTSLIEKVAFEKNVDKQIVSKEMKKTIPVGRFAEPQELAYVVAFLCSNYANYINGINIPVDGGRTLSL